MFFSSLFFFSSSCVFELKWCPFRGIYKGIVRFLSSSVVIIPLPVQNLQATNVGNQTIQVCWQPTSDPLDSTSVATGFKLYQSGDGYSYNNGVIIFGGSVTCYNVTGLQENTNYFFKVAAFNQGGERSTILSVCFVKISQQNSTFVSLKCHSLVKHVVGAMVVPYGFVVPNVLIVYGYDRAFLYTATNTNQRVTRDYVIQHGLAVSAAGVQYDSAHRGVIANVPTLLNSYKVVIWISGNEGTVVDSITSAQQTAIK